MNEGIVYVLTNPAMPKLVKIGKTGRGVETRLNDLYTTGVPLPFECAYAARMEDMDKVEKAFHGNFSDLLIRMFGQLEILVDPYTDFAKGTVGVRALQSIDIAVRHAESFAAMTDAIA